MSRRALILFALMSVIWGIPYLFIRIAVTEITPPTLVLGRTVIAAAILLPIALVRTDLRQVLGRWRWVVAFAAVEIAIPWVALGSAEQHISSSLAGLLIAGVPLVGAAIALATGGADRFGPVGLLGMLIGVAGVALIVGADFGATDTTALLQIGVVVVGYALGPAILARRLHGLPTVGIMAVSLTLVAIVFLPIGVSQWPATTPSTNVADRSPGPRHRVHGGGVHPVRRPHRCSRTGPRDRDHLHQPGRGRGPGRGRAAARPSRCRWRSGSHWSSPGSVLATRPARTEELEATPAAA